MQGRFALGIAVGMPVSWQSRIDPYVRHYLIRLLPWVDVAKSLPWLAASRILSSPVNAYPASACKSQSLFIEFPPSSAFLPEPPQLNAAFQRTRIFVFRCKSLVIRFLQFGFVRSYVQLLLKPSVNISLVNPAFLADSRVRPSFDSLYTNAFDISAYLYSRTCLFALFA